MKVGSNREGVRANGLWGRGGRHGRTRGLPVAGRIALLAVVAALAVPAAGIAAGSTSGHIETNGGSAYVPAYLLAQAQAGPTTIFHVIVQGTAGQSSSPVGSDIQSENGKAQKPFASIKSGVVDLPRTHVLGLARPPHLSS